MKSINNVVVVGGGLSGCESAWQIAQSGIHVTLFEMRPKQNTPAHTSDLLCELVCSNSLGSNQRNRPTGLLKEECKLLGSLLVNCAERSAIPAGDALAVDRDLFSSMVTEKIYTHPNIEIVREEITEIPAGPVIIASGPLTSDRLAASIQQLTGENHLFFFDAIAPVVIKNSINMEIAFRASRYKYENDPRGDYINCPFSENQYHVFIEELLKAQKIKIKDLDCISNQQLDDNKQSFFEGCLPIEEIARRDTLSLAFGPMRPVGLRNPHDHIRPFAVVQLRQDDLADTLYNMVGFQTNLLFSEQKRIFSLIPGLEKAEFVRYGQMHRNTFINSPKLLDATLQYRKNENIFFAGQIAGTEGYMGNIASGLIAGMNMSRFLSDEELITISPYTMIGAILHYISNANPSNFQPMKANFGLLPKLDRIPQNKQERGFCYAKRSFQTLTNFVNVNSY